METVKKHDEDKLYKEYIYRAVIEKIKPDFNFEKSESPDFFDNKNDVGMEVTIADVGNSHSISMKYAKLQKGCFRKPEKIIKELSKCGKITDFGYFPNMFDINPCNSVCKQLNRKLRKLEHWYDNYKSHWLALSLEVPLFEYTEKVKDVVMEGNKDKEVCFDKVFVIAINRVVEIESKTGIYNVIDFTFDEMAACNRRAEKELMLNCNLQG